MNAVPAATTLDDRLRYEARLVLSREPSPQELDVLRKLYEKTLTSSHRPTLMRASMKEFRESPRHSSVSANEFQALRAVGSVLLNLDAAMTR